MSLEWTKPHYGVQHCPPGASVTRDYRCSVSDYEAFAVLHCWFPGCGFSPIEETHNTAAEAREAGEKWLGSSGVQHAD